MIQTGSFLSDSYGNVFALKVTHCSFSFFSQIVTNQIQQLQQTITELQAGVDQAQNMLIQIGTTIADAAPQEQEEIQAIKDLRVKREQLMSDFGFIEIRIQELTLQKENLTNLLVEVMNSEATLSNTLQSKYGNGSIDLDKGEITVVG